jgi:hypothetical protein
MVMQSESSMAEIAVVCLRAIEAGFEATVFDSEPGVIISAGERASEATERLADLPGVGPGCPSSLAAGARSCIVIGG